MVWEWFPGRNPLKFSTNTCVHKFVFLERRSLVFSSASQKSLWALTCSNWIHHYEEQECLCCLVYLSLSESVKWGLTLCVFEFSVVSCIV